MKQIISIVIILFSLSLSSQKFKSCFSGSFGLINPKFRVQFEKPIKNNVSYGMNLNYYLINWKGPVFEPFIRVYRVKKGNKEGVFGQLKLSYGNLSTINFEKEDYIILKRRWSTFGAGIAGGYKFLINDKFIIESLVGLRFLRAPIYRFTSGKIYNYSSATLEAIEWQFKTGSLIDFQLKLGYQF